MPSEWPHSWVLPQGPGGLPKYAGWGLYGLAGLGVAGIRRWHRIPWHAPMERRINVNHMLVKPVLGLGGIPDICDHLRPTERRYPFPVVMIHGACNTGTCFLTTPDGRPGWAYNFAEEGVDTFVIDWPGHGRSPMRANFLKMSTRDVRDSIAYLCSVRSVQPCSSRTPLAARSRGHSPRNSRTS
jgi:pimeloyl-ACP methyl ester carboxylesterase